MELGVQVIPNILSPEECNRAINATWDSLEDFGFGLSRHDPSTWGKERWPPQVHGILKYYVGHADVLWSLRTHPRVVGAFSQLWNCNPEDLLVSYDGMCIVPPDSPQGGAEKPLTGQVEQHPRGLEYTLSVLQQLKTIDRQETNHNASLPLESLEQAPNCPTEMPFAVCDQDVCCRHRGEKSWVHVDQAPARNTMECVQGLINLEDMSAEDATLVVFPTSQLLHKIVAQELGVTTLTLDWFRLNPDQLEWIERARDEGGLGLKAFYINAPRGSLVLWDSRTFHCGTVPHPERKTSNRWRYVAYMCFTPRSMATEEMLEIKRNAFKEGKMTNHWPHRPMTNSTRVPHFLRPPHKSIYENAPEGFPTADEYMDHYFLKLREYDDNAERRSQEILENYGPLVHSLSGFTVDWDAITNKKNGDCTIL